MESFCVHQNVIVQHVIIDLIKVTAVQIIILFNINNFKRQDIIKINWRKKILQMAHEHYDSYSKLQS